MNKGLIPLNEIPSIPLEGFYETTNHTAERLREIPAFRGFHNGDNGMSLIDLYFKMYGLKTVNAKVFLTLLSNVSNNPITYQDPILMLKVIKNMYPDSEFISSYISKIMHNESLPLIIADMSVNFFDENEMKLISDFNDKTVKAADVTSYLKILKKIDMTKTETIILTVTGADNNRSSSTQKNFVDISVANIPKLMAGETTIRELYNEYMNDPNKAEVHKYTYAELVDSMDEHFLTTPLAGIYSKLTEFLEDHKNCGSFIIDAEEKYFLEKCASDNDKLAIKTIFDQIRECYSEDLLTKCIYADRDSAMIDNFIDSLDESIKSGYLTQAEYGIAFLEQTFKNWFKNI